MAAPSRAEPRCRATAKQPPNTLSREIKVWRMPCGLPSSLKLAPTLQGRDAGHCRPHRGATGIISAQLRMSCRDACGDRDLEPAIRVHLNFSELLPQRTNRKHAPSQPLTTPLKKNRRDVTGSFAV